ncbi:MAG: hypothetical protein HOP29_10875 [Phycisphaerales bacterium]|nr:hypothetical protein [Phycisphaerales bacterium]
MDILFLLGTCCAIAITAYVVGRASRDDEIEKSRVDAAKFEAKLREVEGLFDETLRGIREDSVLLPSLVRWAQALDEARDKALSLSLQTKRRPAPKAAEEVRLARTESRHNKRALRLAMNRVDLYESLAPWLLEYTDLSLAELIDAMREEKDARASAERGEDPISRYVPKTEWNSLSSSERNQLALDRYCDPRRKRTPWAAGIEYERFVGYTYEKSGYHVTYQGALRGREDLGIDLLCENDACVLIVQCKRLSQEKQLPVRENVVAQVFGSAEFYRMCSGTPKPVRPVLATTYRLSDEASRFAGHLKVNLKEHFAIAQYPMIKCNVSRVDGQRIYHLPLDQQYDNAVIGDREDEFYASTVNEAESAGFRRAFRWRGGDDPEIA